MIESVTAGQCFLVAGVLMFLFGLGLLVVVLRTPAAGRLDVIREVPRPRPAPRGLDRTRIMPPPDFRD